MVGEKAFLINRNLEKIGSAFKAEYPLIYILSWEEERVEKILRGIYQKFFPNGEFAIWTCSDGLNGKYLNLENHKDPFVVLEKIVEFEGEGIFILKDLPDFLEHNIALIRKLRDCYNLLKNKRKFIIILSPKYYIPEQLKKEIHIIEFDLPNDKEIYSFIKPIIKEKYGEEFLNDEKIAELSIALKGLTLNEIWHMLKKMYEKETFESILEKIFLEKEQIIKKEGILEFVPPRYSIEEIGGLDNLKEWLIKRQNLFTPEALAAKLPVPSGILLMGISGCGKSLAIKAISSLWKIPLFRLDMNLVFSGVYGTPESVFHKALKQMEALAPAVLWIDEIEMGVAGYREGESVTSAHIFAHFLTWMQEKNAFVFVGATANRIHLLPAEVIRKGRFDQIFFVDLPDDEERKQIFSIHIKKNGGNPSNFDLVFLSAATKGWNGSEIEQAVISARIDAFYEKRQFNIDDIVRNISRMVPLSRTMETQIKQIKSWAFDRAIPASSSKFRK